MKMARWCLVAGGLAAIVAIAAATMRGPAEGTAGFRVDNWVFVGDEQRPQSQSVTVFHDGRVYDFLTEPDEITVFDKLTPLQHGDGPLDKPAEITIFDPGHHRFVLLDPAHRVMTEVDSDGLAALCAKLQGWAKGQTDPEAAIHGRPAVGRGVR